jgi:murein L,D-transpeptidase YcbB/YkuD
MSARLVGALGLVALLTLLPGCASESVTGGDGSGSLAVTAPSGSGAWQRQLRASMEADAAAHYTAFLDAQVAERPIEALLLGEEPRPGLERRTFLAHAYAAREWRPAFVGTEDIGARAQAILDTLNAAGAHALDPGDYLTEERLEALDRFAQLAHARAQLPDVSLTSTQLDALLAREALDAAEGAGNPALAVLEIGLASNAEALASLLTFHQARLELERAFVGARALADVSIADAALAYAFDQRHFNPHYLSIESPTDDEKHAEISARMRATFDALAAAPTAEAMQTALDALPPSHPQYAGLLAERARYAAIVEDGGWQRVAPTTLRRGSRGPRVIELKRRLAREGYFEGDLEDDRFGDTLQQAVRRYQATHQMDVTGESSRDFWSSINIGADRRLQQIDLTLQRWRENRIGDDPRYLWVNIPDMHAEAWRDGQRDMRFRIVVGNTTRQCDPRTRQMAYVNATPVQSATMSYVVLNPTWSVPIRIAREELLPELLENPNYFEEQGFEHIINDNGTEIIRQSPGPNNPLGKVKFMFPNPHNTYMHDTSRPQYFRFPIRAFSHGCMRVSEPDALLEYVLQQDGQWDERQIERIFEGGEETTISLREHIPVHMEYYVVTVDDDGYANFLADIYRLDRDRLDPPSANDLACDPDPTPDHRLVLVDGELRIEDTEGVQHTREEWEALNNPSEGSGERPVVQDDLGVPASVLEGDYGP